jgi:hypothetical protein
LAPDRATFRPGIGDVRLVVEEREHAQGGGHGQEALVIELVQLPQGPEDLDAKEEDDQ